MTVEQLLSECDLVRLTEENFAACKPFSCGEGDLDEFFAKDCLVNQVKRFPAVLIGRLGTSKDFAGQGYGTAIMDFIKVLFRTNNRTGCRFLIVDALNRPDTLHYYEKNGFRYLIADERLEAKYMGIGVGRLPLNTRLMYFDLLKLKVNS
jgi:GNAT superfamily N-acetyltransferase